jgi:hypothetical protein
LIAYWCRGLVLWGPRGLGRVRGRELAEGLGLRAISAGVLPTLFSGCFLDRTKRE